MHGWTNLLLLCPLIIQCSLGRIFIIIIDLVYIHESNIFVLLYEYGIYHFKSRSVEKGLKPPASSDVSFTHLFSFRFAFISARLTFHPQNEHHPNTFGFVW